MVCYESYLSIIKELIKVGVDINWRYGDVIVLMVVCFLGNISVV